LPPYLWLRFYNNRNIEVSEKKNREVLIVLRPWQLYCNNMSKIPDVINS